MFSFVIGGTQTDTEYVFSYNIVATRKSQKVCFRIVIYQTLRG